VSRRSAVTTHVLDTARGAPAAGVRVRLERVTQARTEPVAEGLTDGDGRISDLGPQQLPEGTYRLVFATGAYLTAQAGDSDAGPPGPPGAPGEPGTRRAPGLPGPPGAPATGAAPRAAQSFFPEVAVTFTVTGREGHYHVPLLLSPFGYTTYRGS